MKLTHSSGRGYDSAQRLWLTAMTQNKEQARHDVNVGGLFCFGVNTRVQKAPFQPFDTARFNP
ncbi:hypothetical protein BR1R3_00800 [Pseudomonas atacamensis]|nr:hypothetical protein BR1R3_00800 [Pseudomonas atacamensis]